MKTRFAVAVASATLMLCAAAGAQTPAGSAAAEPPASAEGSASDDKKAEARAHFEKAVLLFEEEAWDAALAEFLKSRETFATRAATKNAAISLRKLHRFDEALDMFEALLREFPNLPPDDKALAEKETSELRALVGALEVRGAESGATIIVDGRDRGTYPPAAPIRVPAGTHVVRVFKEGFTPFESRVDVAGGQATSVNAKLGALTQSGRLKVTEQKGQPVEVLVDNVVVGKTPWEGSLALGDHTVVLRGEGNVGTQPAAAPVKLNQVTALTLLAEELGSQIRVEPTPNGGSVALDGVVVGRGLWEGKLRVGGHRIEVAAEGFLPATRQVTLEAGKRDVVTVALERDPTSPLWRAANPPRIIFDVTGAFAMAPLIGGDLQSSCGSCSTSLGTGMFGQFHGGYQFGSGLALALEAGYLQINKQFSQRDTTLQPVGFQPETGKAKDKLKLSGMLLGASGAYHRGEKFPITVRLGAGVMLAQVSDTRTGSFTTTNPVLPSPVSYSVSAQEDPSATYFYLAPELRIGWRLGGHLEPTIGVSAIVLQAIKQPKWTSDQAQLSTQGDGLAEYRTQTLTGSTLLVIAPSLGLRYDLSL